MIDPVFACVLAGCTALLFAGAAIHKWRDYAGFREVLVRYEVLPESAARALAWCVPLLESLVAAALLLPPTRACALAGAGLMLVAYASAIALNLRRGRRSLECGCGGPARQAIAPWMAWRNLLIAALLPLALPRQGARPLTLLDAATIVMAVCALALLYRSIERLFSLPTRPAHVHSP
jgi:uncharacterized membrane protein YphA (DoxX/SURF4 family)